MAASMSGLAMRAIFSFSRRASSGWLLISTLASMICFSANLLLSLAASHWRASTASLCPAAWGRPMAVLAMVVASLTNTRARTFSASARASSKTWFSHRHFITTLKGGHPCSSRQIVTRSRSSSISWRQSHSTT